MIRAGEGSGRRPPTGLRDGPRPRGGRARGDASEGRARGVEVARRTISPGGRARSPASGDAGPRRGQRARGRRRAGARGRGGGEGRAGRKRGRGRNNPPRPARARGRERERTVTCSSSAAETLSSDASLAPEPDILPLASPPSAERARARATALVGLRGPSAKSNNNFNGPADDGISSAELSRLGRTKTNMISFHLDPSDADAPPSPRLSPPLRAARLTARRTPSPSSSPPSARPSPASSSPPPPRR